jgi:uncharacterized protein (DUF736 family)
MSRLECGSFAFVARDGIEYRGRVQLGHRIDCELILRKHPRAGSFPNHPDFTVEAVNEAGKTRPIGAAWIKNSDRVGDFLSMTLEDPDWPTALNLSVYPPIDGAVDTSWTVVWSRPRGARVQDETRAPTDGATHAG